MPHIDRSALITNPAALLAFHRAHFGDLRMELQDGETAEPASDAEPGAQEPGATDGAGFPEKTPVKDMTVDQQVAYWKQQSRKHEDASKARADYDAIKAERDQLKQQHETEQEKALREARELAEVDAQRRGATTAAEAVLRIALRSAQKDISDEAVDEAVALTNLSALLAETGGIDEKKVLAAASRYAVTASGPAGPDMGQGNRGTSRTTPGAAGAAEAERRFGKTA